MDVLDSALFSCLGFGTVPGISVALKVRNLMWLRTEITAFRRRCPQPHCLHRQGCKLPQIVWVVFLLGSDSAVKRLAFI